MPSGSSSISSSELTSETQISRRGPELSPSFVAGLSPGSETGLTPGMGLLVSPTVFVARPGTGGNFEASESSFRAPDPEAPTMGTERWDLPAVGSA